MGLKVCYQGERFSHIIFIFIFLSNYDRVSWTCDTGIVSHVPPYILLKSWHLFLIFHFPSSSPCSSCCSLYALVFLLSFLSSNPLGVQPLSSILFFFFIQFFHSSIWQRFSTKSVHLRGCNLSKQVAMSKIITSGMHILCCLISRNLKASFLY